MNSFTKIIDNSFRSKMNSFIKIIDNSFRSKMVKAKQFPHS